MPISRPAPRRRQVLAVVAAIAVAACGQANPTSSAVPNPTSLPSATPGGSQPPAAEVYAAIRSDVEAIRGLQPTAAVDPVTIDEAQLRKNLEAEFDRENTAVDLKFSEETLSLLGLLPAGSSLRALTLDFQGSQVAGYYSPDQKELFVVSRSGTLGAPEKVTYAHEFTHQLQDQHFDLSKLGVDATNQTDRALAQLALVEGDAVSVQTTWTLQNLTSEEIGQLLAASLDPAALEALRRAPAYLQETALFPYQDGLGYVTSLLSGGYDDVNAAFADPPDSTEQILHPEKYAQREAPVDVKLPGNLAKIPGGTGWSEAGQDTLGELVLRIWLTQNGVAATVARDATAGWGGDRLVLLRGPSGRLTIGLRTVWDTNGDADEFAAAATTAITKLGSDRAIRHAKGSKTVILAIGDAADHLVGALSG